MNSQVITNPNSEITYDRRRNESGQWGIWEIPVLRIIDLTNAHIASDGNSQNKTEALFCGEFTEAKYIGSAKIQGLETGHYRTVFSLDGTDVISQIERDVWIADGRIVQVTVHMTPGKNADSFPGGFSGTFTGIYSGWDEPNIIVAPVTGTLHEAFLEMGADGGADSLEPAGFTH